jgi:hypothetical protein
VRGWRLPLPLGLAALGACAADPVGSYGGVPGYYRPPPPPPPPAFLGYGGGAYLDYGDYYGGYGYALYRSHRYYDRPPPPAFRPGPPPGPPPGRPPPSPHPDDGGPPSRKTVRRA